MGNEPTAFLLATYEMSEKVKSMKKQTMRCLLAVLLVLTLVISFAACGEDPVDTTTPDTTVQTPETTEPKDTEPAVTGPEETKPVETLPEETLPAETLPAETLPEESEPEESKPADGHRHVFETMQTIPSCTAPGRQYYFCACGEIYTLEYDEPFEHLWELTESVPATCTETGSETYVCTLCHTTDIRLLPLLAHDLSISCAL